MLGAIAGDIVGSIYEFDNIKTKDFPLFAKRASFTDDSVLTVALADALLTGQDYGVLLKSWARTYPDAGYGGNFVKWMASDDPRPYNSFGNGSAMRASPVGFAFDDMTQVLDKARWSAAFTHDHPEGIKGAQATAGAILLARQGQSKAEIADWVTRQFDYDLSEPLASIRQWYKFDVTCQGTMPPAIIAFLEADGFEDALRNAISIGGDSDTLACITGSIAQAWYGMPDWIAQKTLAYLDERLYDVVMRFQRHFMSG